MKPLDFDGVNVIFGTNQPEYQPLPGECIGKPETGQVITCWGLDADELKIVQETGRIFVSVLTFGQHLQPILCSVVKPTPYDPE